MTVKNTGFPSPAEEYREGSLSLDKHLIKNPSATYFMTMEGDSMLPTIRPGDILMIDRSLTPVGGNLIVGNLQGEFIVRRLILKNGERFLINEKQTSSIKLLESEDFVLFGVVSWTIHKAI